MAAGHAIGQYLPHVFLLGALSASCVCFETQFRVLFPNRKGIFPPDWIISADRKRV